MSNLLRAFSNINRIKIISCLGSKEKNVSELITHCKLSQSAVSQHLMKLKQDGIVTSRKIGRLVFYKVNYAELPEITKKIYYLAEKYPNK
jgi:DNA-binding transcriptional ArsR family regulator